MSKMVKKEEQAITQPMQAARGFENFKKEDLDVPRLRLLQGLSEAVVSGEGKMGQFQDSLSGLILGDEVEVVLLGMKNSAVYFKKGEGRVCGSPDGITNDDGVPCQNCPYGEYHARKWAKGENPPACASSKEFMCITKATVEGKEKHPMVVSFLKTGYKTGKNLASTAFYTGRDIFAASYKIKSVIMKNPDNQPYAVMQVKQTGWLTDEELKVAEAWYNLIKTINVNVHDSSEDSESVPEDVSSDDV